ncbi:archaellin/type IV pilin N-terminal domain-containing protein [Haloarcula salinisoli]|uniref:Flagellin n=1 Tax=Haloarcula salinisoli TaxID=2487746 RepID=A0A8J7YIS3_9EURY|nr:archaellin/type IV pilin N-terminal domain-containing protein [Halomicroarcula salinisoli]MBX0286500.1 flagellin [Halomicroarcula salinisoli]MBX0303849.1 flagellin [Halomicroarcula salinisoli]
MYSLNDQAPDDRGQVGIGTLIVFIAMVLVAAIAAGVLINTAGFLQSGAEATGQGASDATSNRIQVVSTTGTDLDNSTVGVVSLVVKAGPGASNIDLETTTVQWVGPNGSFYQLAENSTGGNPDGYFAVATVQDSDGSSPVLNDQEDRLKIQLELGEGDNETLIDGAEPFGSEIGEGESATIRITTASGSQTTEEILVPETISGTTAVRL